jgi:hypothetical protein
MIPGPHIIDKLKRLKKKKQEELDNRRPHLEIPIEKDNYYDPPKEKDPSTRLRWDLNRV